MNRFKLVLMCIDFTSGDNSCIGKILQRRSAQVVRVFKLFHDRQTHTLKRGLRGISATRLNRLRRQDRTISAQRIAVLFP
jgi:hypothetical protein